MEVLRDHAVLDGEDRFHHPERTGGRLGVAKVGFRRSKHARVATAVDLGCARILDRVTDWGTGAMRLDHADGAGFHTRRGQRRAVHRGLRLRRRHRDIHGVAVLVGGRSTHDSQNPVTIPLGIRESLEQQHHAALAGHESVRFDIERVAVSGARQHAPRRRRRGPARFHHHVDAAGEGKLAFAVVQAAAGLVDGKQTRRAGGVHGARGTVEPERVGDAPGCHAGNGAGVSVRPVEGIGGDVHELVVAVIQSNENAGFASDGRLGEAGVLHGLPRRLHQQAVLGIHRRRFFITDAEELGIEVADVVQERTPLAYRPTRHARLGVVVVVDVPALGRNLGHQIVTAQQCVPEEVRGVDAPRQPARHAYDSNRCNTCLIHCPSPLLAYALVLITASSP